jgi:hypothetical protein
MVGKSVSLINHPLFRLRPHYLHTVQRHILPEPAYLSSRKLLAPRFGQHPGVQTVNPNARPAPS